MQTMEKLRYLKKITHICQLTIKENLLKLFLGHNMTKQKYMYLITRTLLRLLQKKTHIQLLKMNIHN